MSMIPAKLDNSPNAEKLLDSLRYLGYDNLLAISDIVDNSIDADAQEIRIKALRTQDGNFVIQIADNGIGMTEPILDQASRLGSQTQRSPGTDLGRFGMGLVTASLSMGRRLTIVTRAADDELLTNVTDVDHMIHSNRFLKEYFGPARKEEVQLFHTLLGDSPSGTIVQISKTDGFTRKYTKVFERELERHLGQVYRMFIRAGRKLFVNKEEVTAHDPLWLDQGAQIYSDETYTLKDANGQEYEEPIRVRLAILPDHGSTSSNAKAGYRAERSGFYVLRNNREIASAQLLGLTMLSRHPDFNRFRGEIFISGRLDEAFGIELTKRDVKPTQSIRDQLEELVGADIKSIRARLKKQVVSVETQKVDHSHAEKLIESKAGLLIKPPVKSGRGRQTRRSADVQVTGPTNGSTEGQSTEEANQTALGTVKFRTANFGQEGPIYAAEQQGRTTFIDWNVDHPFYERFVLANRNNNEVFNAVDAMIFSMAVAELKVFDEDNEQFIRNWKTIFSMNLRTLLS